MKKAMKSGTNATTAVVAFVATGPIDDFFANIGIWLHRTNEWSFPEFDTIERFSKIGFAIRAIFIAVGISFLYFWISNWLNMGLARVLAQHLAAFSQPACEQVFNRFKLDGGVRAGLGHIDDPVWALEKVCHRRGLRPR